MLSAKSPHLIENSRKEQIFREGNHLLPQFNSFLPFADTYYCYVNQFFNYASFSSLTTNTKKELTEICWNHRFSGKTMAILKLMCSVYEPLLLHQTLCYFRSRTRSACVTLETKIYCEQNLEILFLAKSGIAV